MYGQTINNDMTQAGDGNPLLAGRYHVVRQLGTGGMGSVWLAEDNQLDNKLFAVKMLPSILVSNKRAYRQLKDEALVAMQLVHPNIVQIRAFEENDGNPFLVMDYIEGQTLDDYLAEHAGTTGVSPIANGLPEADVLRILRPIAAALDYAHGEGVVHRDVKPANVMIRRDGHPYILDFGIAREIQETMTRVTGKLSSGTLLYMSPEQLMGDRPAPAQDVYSFAAMAYECLKGEPPFSRGAIEDQIKNKEPETLPGGSKLVASIMGGLAKRPEARPATCAAVLAGKRQGAASPSAKRYVGSAWKVPLIAVALLALAGGGIWYRQHLEAKREQARIIAERRAEETRKAEEEAWRKAKEAEEQKIRAERKAAEERRTKEEAERKRNAEVKRLAAERKAKDSATAIRIEAKVQQGKMARISDADGFKARKDSLEDIFIRAEAFYDDSAKRWAEAEALYRDYIEQSKSVISFDGERQQAVANRSAVQASFKKAEDAGAKTYARESWNSAVKTWNEAVGEFGRGEFAAATEIFAKALREFEDCAIEAQNNKRIADEKLAEEKRLAEARAAEERRRAELARQAEERRRQEERRKAMQSLPGKWRCQTTLMISYMKDHPTFTQYEYDFRNSGDYVETVTGMPRGYENNKSVTTTTGTWRLFGNTLTLHSSSSSTILPSGSVSKNHTKTSYDYKVLWKNDGSFELRFADSHPFEEKTMTVSYDYQGSQTLHVKTGGFLIPSQEYDIVETAKIFRKVSN